MKVTWVNFLHFYQPPMADNETVIEATEKSYIRIVKALQRNPRVKFTFNIAGSLLEHWQKLGYGQLIKDISGLVHFSKAYIDKNSGLKLCFRSREFSKSYVPQTIFGIIKDKLSRVVITATDAELYGLRHNDISANFEKLLRRPELETLTVSGHLRGLLAEEIITPVASSWESTAEELARHSPYHLWYDKKNKIQVKLWTLANLAIRVVNKYKNDINYAWARQHLDRGLASCTFWWASARDFRLFGPLSWNPDEIERGVNELIRSIRALDDQTTRSTKIKAEKIYIKIKKLIWQKHWRYYWKK